MNSAYNCAPGTYHSITCNIYQYEYEGEIIFHTKSQYKHGHCLMY